MDCLESHNMMSAYLDDELDPSTAARYAAHLVSCAACKNAYDELMRLRTTLKFNATTYSAPSHLRRRIQADLDASKPRREKQKKLSWGWINFGVATACTIAFALTLSLYLAVP